MLALPEVEQENQIDAEENILREHDKRSLYLQLRNEKHMQFGKAAECLGNWEANHRADDSIHR
jgi:hypothetical protein